MIDILRPKYKAALDAAKAGSTAAVKKGVGVSVGVYGCGLDGPDTSEADAELNPDGTVTIYNCWEDHGQGADMGSLGTAHEALRPLGIAPQNIRLVLNDTSKAPNSGPAGGSRSQYVTGNAVRVACENLVEAMRKPGGFRTYQEMVDEKIATKHRGAWTAAGTHCDENAQGKPFTSYMYGVFMAEVAVELATGKTTVPYIKDIPDNIELIYVETPRGDGPFGASGVGELPLSAPHASIINGIYHACGVRIRHLPALPEKVLAGLKGA